jgi:RNA polymerase primary sigma factor
MDKYMSEVIRIKLITAEEEVDLARMIHKGDLDARNRLITANLKFVISVSKQFQNQGLSLPDLINEGNLGLIDAAQRFDETRGFKFISYAVWWIRQSIIQALAKQARIVHLPLNVISNIHKIKRSVVLLGQKYEREPTTLEISQALDMTPDDVTLALRNSGKYISLDAPFIQDEEENMYDVLSNEDDSNPDKELLTDSLRKDINKAIDTLTQREADIIRLFFGVNGKQVHTLGEIAEKLNLTRERVRQIKVKAIGRLKHTSRSRILKTYLY